MKAVNEAKEAAFTIEMDEIPNDITIAAMREAEAMINGEKPCTWYQSSEDLIDALKKEIDS